MIRKYKYCEIISILKMASGFHRNKNVNFNRTEKIQETLEISRRIYIKPIKMDEIQTFFKINKFKKNMYLQKRKETMS